MKKLLMLAAAATIIAAAGSSSAKAQSWFDTNDQQAAWCAVYAGADGDGGRSCTFYTWAQCMETLRGIGGMCYQNLNYHGPQARPRKRKTTRYQ